MLGNPRGGQFRKQRGQLLFQEGSQRFRTPLGARSRSDFFVTMSGEEAPQPDLAGDPIEHAACAMGLNATVSVYILLIYQRPRPMP